MLVKDLGKWNSRLKKINTVIKQHNLQVIEVLNGSKKPDRVKVIIKEV